eukprot:gene16058-22195_t
MSMRNSSTTLEAALGPCHKLPLMPIKGNDALVAASDGGDPGCDLT